MGQSAECSLNRAVTQDQELLLADRMTDIREVKAALMTDAVCMRADKPSYAPRVFMSLFYWRTE